MKRNFLDDSETYDYVKKFVWLMIHTWNEDDGAEKLPQY